MLGTKWKQVILFTFNVDVPIKFQLGNGEIVV